MTYDFAIIGAGMAGASVAAELAPFGSVVILEAEEMPGYHSTGRSAAFWSETYGGPHVQPLTTASYDLLADPPSDFFERSFMEKRGALHIAKESGHGILNSLQEDFDGSEVQLQYLHGEELETYCPGIRPEWDRAIFESSCADIDVGGLHQAYLREARRKNAELRCSAPVSSMEWQDGAWQMRAGEEQIEAATVINAAGAWADKIAELAGVDTVGLMPYRRTVAQLRTNPGAPENLPLIIDAEGQFYFKREGDGRLWLSPHDETPCEPGDVAPEELDIAIAIDRFEKVVNWKIEAVERKWAGLRSFTPDRLPVYGFAPDADGFFWCAGQGGFGIQTAPAGAVLCRSLILGEDLPASHKGIDRDRYAPGR